jgi:hypothetical protein
MIVEGMREKEMSAWQGLGRRVDFENLSVDSHYPIAY